jgi:eukaryotic-like serine/threonine-protein kinase
MLCFVEPMDYRFESVPTKTSGGTSAYSSMTYLAGEVIADRYRLNHELGRGGMGVVWAAHSLTLGVEVAVKLILGDVATETTAGRMMREAQAAARLSHPALVHVFDFGFTNQNHPFLVMELVCGETLRTKLERDGAFQAIEAVKLLLPIADGLRTAHERGIVHRDLKPDNIFIANGGLNRVQPKLLDFGIAKDARAASKLTQAGSVVGTPQYISPEQARGLDTVDERSDVWSFCVMLYELLTGTLPFDEDNYNAQLVAIIERPPARPARRPGDARLWHIILQGLAKDPSSRFQTMAELGEALAAWLYDHQVKVDASGNSLRTVWLDNAMTRNSHSPVSKASGFVRPMMGTGNSRIPPARGNTVRGAALVLAVAASVFGLFELTFATPLQDPYTASALIIQAESEPSPPFERVQPASTAAPTLLVNAVQPVPTHVARASTDADTSLNQVSLTTQSSTASVASDKPRLRKTTRSAQTLERMQAKKRKGAQTNKTKVEGARHDFGF